MITTRTNGGDNIDTTAKRLAQLTIAKAIKTNLQGLSVANANLNQGRGNMSEKQRADTIRQLEIQCGRIEKIFALQPGYLMPQDELKFDPKAV